MKTVLFFHRCDLTRLYIQLTKNLIGKVNIIHVAFSDEDIKKLKSAGIYNFINFQKEFEKQLNNYTYDEQLVQEIDNVIIMQSKGKFCLNGSIQSDRCFTIYNYEESLMLASCQYLVWKSIFNTTKVDIMFHEPCSMFMTHIAALLCKQQGGIYRCHIQESSDFDFYTYLNIDGETFECNEVENHYKYFIEHPNLIDINRCKKYLDKFRSDSSVFMAGVINNQTNKMYLLCSSIRRKLVQIKHSNDYDRYKNYIDYWLLKRNYPYEKLHNLNSYKNLNIKFITIIPKNEKYYYYSLHLEPEATVLYLGYGIYTNQIKLIENIAASLPAGCYLYVKDHPHEVAYRKADDYERLTKVPNLRLIHHAIPGKTLINNAIGVFSINGTAGFEALLLGKQVYCFGKNYYTTCSRVNYINNIKDLREIIYSNIDKKLEDDINLFAFIHAYLKSVRKGFVSYFGDRPEKARIDQEENSNNIAEDILSELKYND